MATINGVNNKLKVQVFFNLLEINQLLMHLNCNSLHGEKWLFFIFCTQLYLRWGNDPAVLWCVL